MIRKLRTTQGSVPYRLGEQSMNLGRTVFSQLISFLPDREFRRCVSRYDGDRRWRGFSCWDQFLCMAFADAAGGCTGEFGEAVNGDFEAFGEERLLKTALQHHDRPARELIDYMQNAVKNHCADVPPTDDMTMVVVRVMEEPSSRFDQAS